MLRLLLVLTLAASCQPVRDRAGARAAGASYEPPADSMTLPTITHVLQRNTPELLRVPGVIGTGEGRRSGQPVFVIYVVRRTAELEERLPHRIEGYAVEVRESGEATKWPSGH